jgi:transcriptional regulator MraZ
MDAPQTVQPIFAGEFRHAMDAKNRVTIPSRWRARDVDEFFAIPNLEAGFLMVMPPLEFKRVAEKVENDESLGRAERRRFIRQFSAKAQHLTSDKQGRMVLAEEQCKLLKLQREVVLVGNYTRFEIWNPDNWRKTTESDAPGFSHVLERAGI